MTGLLLFSTADAMPALESYVMQRASQSWDLGWSVYRELACTTCLRIEYSSPSLITSAIMQ